jgi:hypothetical protein
MDEQLDTQDNGANVFTWMLSDVKVNPDALRESGQVHRIADDE